MAEQKRASETGRLVARGAGLSLLSLLIIPALVLSGDSAQLIAHSMWTNPAILNASLSHLGVWAVLALAMGSGLAWMTRGLGRERALKVVRARRGTVVTETLITLPPFFLLIFGLSQQSVNSMAQILANVAIHRAAHSVWVWEPERAHNTNRAGAVNVNDRACIAVANVMAPVAPGDYASGAGLLASPSNQMKQQRQAMVLSQIPLGGSVPANFAQIINGADLVPSSALQGYLGQRNNSISRALDDSSFFIRSAYKFTAAYRACAVSFSEGTVQSGMAGSGGSGGGSVPGYNVSMTYYHFQAMPLVGRFFSGWFSDVPFVGQIEFASNDATMRAAWEKTGQPFNHFITIRRTLPWPKQIIKPNNRMPNNIGDGSSGGGGGLSRGDLEGANPQ